MVRTLNGMRNVWDPEGLYRNYSFERQPQNFPDVILRRHAQTEREDYVILGIELKGWYLLAKEGVPTFRFVTTPAACAPADLIAVVPWVLSNVTSGTPTVFEPYVELAAYAAQFKNYWWQEVRETNEPREITLPPNARPYPGKADLVADNPVSDRGRNFGRLARTGILDDYIGKALERDIRGIEARHWLAFFKRYGAQSVT
ncbi:MAG TPA: hypothetical protein VEM77_00455 [Thermoplasmata archaeon]|nr:hypothetical protein [Thermoplasmata archaeon]